MESFLRRAAQYYSGKPHQDAAWDWLEIVLDQEVFEEFQARYRGEKADPVKGIKHVLNVPYFYQRDSQTGHGERMCFSSSMAMAIDFLDPEAIEGDDDDYLRIVFKYGDTVSSEAQVKAARSLGMNCEFRTDLTEKILQQQIDKGFPVPIGILHKGHHSSPTGGGHYVCVVGYDQKYFYVHDPFGKLDLINGRYIVSAPEAGRFQPYERDLLMDRFLIANDHDGWGVLFK